MHRLEVLNRAKACSIFLKAYWCSIVIIKYQCVTSEFLETLDGKSVSMIFQTNTFIWSPEFVTLFLRSNILENESKIDNFHKDSIKSSKIDLSITKNANHFFSDKSFTRLKPFLWPKYWVWLHCIELRWEFSNLKLLMEKKKRIEIFQLKAQNWFE